MDYNRFVKTVRQRILDYIRAHRGVTVTELSKAFQMTPANARHHLSNLVGQGLLQVVGDHPVASRGRPANIYALSEGTLGNNLDLLAGVLLTQFASQSNPDQYDEFLRNLASQLAVKMTATASAELHSDASKPGDNLTRRLYQAIEILNQHHYQARWEARPDAPRLVLGHCPFIAILDEHPELCKLDAHLIEHYTGVPAEQTTRLARDSSGLRFCMFRIAKERV